MNIIPLKAKGKQGRYKLLQQTSSIKPYAIYKLVSNFWQQISPHYFRKGNALRYAKQHNITLENI